MSIRQPEPWIQQVMDALAASDNRKRGVHMRLFRLYHVRYSGIVTREALWRYLKGKEYDWVPGRNVFLRMMDDIDRAVAEIRHS